MRSRVIRLLTFSGPCLGRSTDENESLRLSEVVERHSSIVQFRRFSGSTYVNRYMSEQLNNGFGDSSADQQRFLSLFLKSEREIFRYVAALVPNVSDADDIVQQTAITLWEKFDSYDPDRPFTPWACRFALNKARQWIERRRRWQVLLDNGLAEELAQRREEMRPELEVRLNRLEGCLGALPADQRALIEGYYFNRNGIEQLASLSGRTVAATYKMLQRIRHSLQICIESALERKGLAT